MSEITVPICKHYDMTVAELEADGYAMEDMPLCEMCSYDEINRLTAEVESLKRRIDEIVNGYEDQLEALRSET